MKSTQNILSKYKQLITKNFPDEKYKWELLAKYQGKPNIESVDISAELQQIKYNNLVYHNALAVQKHILKNDAEAYREALAYLFNESIALQERIPNFQGQIETIYRKLEPKLAHHHDERTLAAFLSIKYPDKYPIYKASYYDAFCKYLGIKPAKKDEKYIHYIELLTQLITDDISKDHELLQIISDLKTEDCYSDSNYWLLAQDILYQVFREEAKETEKSEVKYWLYSPGEQAVKWKAFYEEGIMALGWDELADLKSYATKEDIKNSLLAAYGGPTDKKNDTTANDEFANKIQIGDIIIVKQGISKLLGYGEVTSDYYFDDEALDYKHRRTVNWLKKGLWVIENDSLVLKTLTDVSSYKSPLNSTVSYPQYLLNYMLDTTPKNSNAKNVAILNYKKQIILQGPPGTGKKREAKQLAQVLLGVKDVENTDQFKLIQFHPSYTYEDFVRGIVAKPNPDGDGVVYEAENKVLAEFASQALDNYLGAKNMSENDCTDNEIFKDFISYVNEKLAESDDLKFSITDNVYIFLSDDSRFKYKGDNWVAHEKGLNMKFSELKKIIAAGVKERQEVKKLEDIEELTKQHATYFIKVVEMFYKFKEAYKRTTEIAKSIELKNYVLIIDEINRANLSSVLGELIYALEYRGEAVDSMYVVNENKQLILPPNLYIIGTMNTADRSVGHIDYAIRRRFAFVDVLPKDLTGEENVLFDAQLFNQVAQLFKDINVSPEFEAKDVQLGHSYFIDKSDEGGTMDLRLEYEIKPILLEYVRDGILIGEGIKQQIEQLKATI